MELKIVEPLNFAIPAVSFELRAMSYELIYYDSLSIITKAHGSQPLHKDLI